MTNEKVEEKRLYYPLDGASACIQMGRCAEFTDYINSGSISYDTLAFDVYMFQRR